MTDNTPPIANTGPSKTEITSMDVEADRSDLLPAQEIDRRFLSWIEKKPLFTVEATMTDNTPPIANTGAAKTEITSKTEITMDVEADRSDLPAQEIDRRFLVWVKMTDEQKEYVYGTRGRFDGK
jgi:hypothetical protein